MEDITNLSSSVFYDSSTNVQDEYGVTYSEDGKMLVKGNPALEEYEIRMGTEIIDFDAFSGCRKLNSIRIPNTVKRIECGAFAYCNGLRHLCIPGSVNELGCDALTGCLNLEVIAIEHGSNSKYMTVDGVLYSKDKKKLIAVPPKIEHFEIPSCVETIGTYAFSNSCIKKISVPETVKCIESYAFYGSKLEQLFMSNLRECIESESFTECKYLTHIEVYETGLPARLTDIKNGAFCDCWELRTVDIPASVKNIEPEAFLECIALKEVYIPASVETIDMDAFSDCSSLEAINVSEENKFYKSIDGILYDKEVKDLILLPMKKKKLVLPKTVESLEPSLLENQELNKISVEEGNKYYRAIDNLLYTADAKHLIYEPLTEEQRPHKGINFF